MMKHISTSFFVFLFPLCVFAQDVVEWYNPSFDISGVENDEFLRGWKELVHNPLHTAAEKRSHFDDLNSKGGNGRFLDLVFRNDGTFEGVYQRFGVVFQKDSVYHFSVSLATTPFYVVPNSPSSRYSVNYIDPVELYLVGVDEKGLVREVLTPVAFKTYNEFWQKQEVYFKPLANSYSALGFIAVPAKTKNLGNGHIFMDSLSIISKVPLNEAVHLTVNPGTEIDKLSILTLNRKCPDRSMGFINNWKAVVYNEDMVDFFSEQNENDRPKDIAAVLPCSNEWHDKTFENSQYLMAANDEGNWLAFYKKLDNDYVLHIDSSYSLQLIMSKAYQVKNCKVMGAKYHYMAFDSSLQLQIWGGNLDNPRKERLYCSPLIKNGQWKLYECILKPKTGNWDVLLLEAYYPEGSDHWINGSLMVDKISKIIKIVN